MVTATPTVYTQVTNDLAGERNMDARYIGLLDPDRTMLNIQSALSSASDKIDTYRLRMMKDGPMGIGVVANDKEGTSLDASAVKVEILNRGGRVIADSTAKSGALKEAWDKIAGTSYEAKQGDYYVRVTRGPASSANAILQYNLQIRSTFNYRDDYTTIEKPASTAAVTYGKNAVATSLAGVLTSAAYEELTDAQKLFGALQA